MSKDRTFEIDLTKHCWQVEIGGIKIAYDACHDSENTDKALFAAIRKNKSFIYIGTRIGTHTVWLDSTAETRRDTTHYFISKECPELKSIDRLRAELKTAEAHNQLPLFKEIVTDEDTALLEGEGYSFHFRAGAYANEGHKEENPSGWEITKRRT